jgi:Carboxypeptidase regulatory-like domain/TonB-dependent Receptor Plug Domain
MWRLWRVIAVLLCFTLFLVPGAFAQSQATTGVIEGTVVDESGGVLLGAAVSLKNTGTNFEKVLTTGPDGRFRGVLLPLGPYRVTVTLTGFTTLVREGLDLAVGQTINLTLTLKVSAVSQEVLVTAANPVIETTRAEGSTMIGQREVANLPNNGRNFLDFAKLTPSVSIVQGPDGDEMTINGQKGIANNVSVDGADFNNPFFGEQRGGQRPPFTFNLDAVKEVVVVTDGANAEFGRSSSGFVNVVTKSGTNDVHGSFHVHYKYQGIASAPINKDGSTAPKYDFNQLQYGATLGGPISKDKLFYFLSVDLQDASSTKQIDPNRIEQRVVDYFASVGSPEENGSITRGNDAQVALGKLDWLITQNHLATVRATYTKSHQPNGTFDVDSWGRSANAIENDDSRALSGTLISTFSDTLLNEFRFQFAKENRPRPYNGPLITGETRPLPDTAFDFAKAYRFGEPFFIPVDYYDTRVQFNDNLTIIAGSHEVKMGFEYNHVNSSQVFRGFMNGRYIFSSTDGFLNYAHNPNYVECSDGSSSATGTCPAGTSIAGPVLWFLQQAGVGDVTAEEGGTQSINQFEPGVFIQDKWTPVPNFTIQFGLRYEQELEPDPITPPDEVFFAPFIGTTVNGQAFPSDGTIPSDKSMWQPRLGITWDPANDGKTVIRASGGIFYARIPGLYLASARSTNGSRLQGIFRSSALTPFLGPVPAYPNLLPQSSVAIPDHPDVYIFDKNFKNPKTTSFSIGVDREITPDFAVSLKGNYADTTQLTRYINTNDPLLGSNWSTGLPDASGGNTNGVATLWTAESTAKSRYWGVTLGLLKKWSDNYQFQVFYTYSEDKSDDDNERDPFKLQYAKVTDLGAEYSWSDRHQRDRFNGIFLWQAPGKINVNVRYSYRSAQPMSIKADGTPAETPQDRCSARTAAGGCTADSTVTKRNLGHKDNKYSSLDFSLSRPFPVAGMVIEPILEVYNLFNSKNLRKPESGSLIFNFDGTVQSGLGDPRQAQLGVRLTF